jgi:hypothetical protein
LAFGRFENGVQPAIRRNDDEDENEDEDEDEDEGEEDRGPQERFPRIRYSEAPTQPGSRGRDSEHRSRWNHE